MRRLFRPLVAVVIGVFCETHSASAQLNNPEFLETARKAATEALNAMTNDPDVKKLLGQEELRTRITFDATDDTPTSVQLKLIAHTFSEDPDQTIGAKQRVELAARQIDLNIGTSKMGENARLLTSVRDNLTERQAQQLNQHIDAAIKQSLDGLDANGLVSLFEQVQATGRSGGALDDHFGAIVRNAITGFSPGQ